MKKFLIKLFLFCLLLILADYTLGNVLERMRLANESKFEYIINNATEDILIFGSSRALRHYNPEIIEDSLGLSCFNCGESAMGILHNYILFSALTERHHPKLVIYDFYPPFDVYDDGNNYKYLSGLKPYKENKNVYDFICQIDPNEKYKMLSNLYCYNTICNEIVLGYIGMVKERPLSNEGYLPINKTFDEHRARQFRKLDYTEVDSLKQNYLMKMIEKMGEKHIILCVSPLYYKTNHDFMSDFKMISDEYHVPFIDFSKNPQYVHNKHLFYDNYHLNAIGADEFTLDLLPYIKKQIKETYTYLEKN